MRQAAKRGFRRLNVELRRARLTPPPPSADNARVDPIDTTALSVAAQMRLADLPAQLAGGTTSSADLGASLFEDAARLDLSPAAQALISGEQGNENQVTDAAHAIGLTDWPT